MQGQGSFGILEVLEEGAQRVGRGHQQGRPPGEVRVTLGWEAQQFNSCPPPPTPQEVGALAAANSRGTLWEGEGLRAWGRGGGRPAQTLLLPFYGLTVSEAALTRTSAIRLPRCLGPETRGGAGGGAGGQPWERRVPWEEGEGREPGSPQNAPSPGQASEGCGYNGG